MKGWWSMCRRTTQFHTRLGFERLETRELLSGVTAVLDDGVLAVTGASDSSSEIEVWRQADRIVVNGVAASFSAPQVQSITVACGQNGDQTVYLGIARTRMQTALARPVTVYSGSGNETVLLGSTSVYFAGTGHWLAVSAMGGSQLDGAPLTWFDMHIQDAGIRSLAKADFRDQVLGRDDMLGIFNEVEQRGNVTAVELGGLQAIAQNSALFSGVADVQNLSAKVALGNFANAHYQGQRLGNLAAGATADHLEDLVDKWFLGLDHPNSRIGGVTYAYAKASASLFPYTPEYTDVRQGLSGDCYLLAGLAEIVMQDPGAIQSMFIVNDDGTYTVRFYNGQQADYVTVDAYLPVNAKNQYVFANYKQSLTDTNIALWVPLVEKAYAQINEEGWLRTGGQNSYASLDLGWPNDVFTEVTAIPAVGNLPFTRLANFVQFVSAYQAGSMLCFISKAAPTDPRIVDNHVYAVVRYDAATRSVLVFNPWGIDNGTGQSGLISLSWANVVGNCRCWSRSL
jgi:hypothetical protein